jgi:hypothetical protein
LGYDVVTLEINPRCLAHIIRDILKWQSRKAFQPGDFDLVVASPPCIAYSQATTTKPREFSHADRIVKTTMEIIRYLQPEMWWIENPRVRYLGKHPFMQGIPYCDVDYCQFSDWGYKRPTRIRGSDQIARLPCVLCKPSTCPSTIDGPRGVRVHVERLGGNHMRDSTEQKAIVPQNWSFTFCRMGFILGHCSLVLGDPSMNGTR